MTDYTATVVASRAAGETNDCAVKAVAIATGTDYETVHRMFADDGRKPRHGVPEWHYCVIADDLGFRPEAIWPTERTVRTFARNHPHGRYLVGSSDHVCAVVDGQILDWDRRSLKRIKSVYELVKR